MDIGPNGAEDVSWTGRSETEPGALCVFTGVRSSATSLSWSAPGRFGSGTLLRPWFSFERRKSARALPRSDFQPPLTLTNADEMLPYNSLNLVLIMGISMAEISSLKSLPNCLCRRYFSWKRNTAVLGRIPLSRWSVKSFSSKSKSWLGPSIVKVLPLPV